MRRWLPAVLVLAVLSASGCAAVRSSLADDDPWGPGKQWLSLRAGYSKSTVEGSGYGGVGYGFGYSRMLTKVRLYRWTWFKQFSLGGYVHHEVLSRLGGASQIEVPATLELARHFKMNTALRPYVGFGAGPFYRKTYRTGADQRNVEVGYYLTLGANTPISGRHLLGLDTRVIRVDESNIPANPVFGLGSAKRTDQGTLEPRRGTHWSVKLTYTLTE